ncbi:MAG: single-stranded-DNA-specific exonuclease RecJ, partial [Planctomycetales bacterium]|nr:single-stranded-DNA-specific exonuclease RecJ [Planctomycetales bacterium]
MGKRWRIFPHDADRVTRLEKAAGVSPVVAQLMICRGIYEPAAVRTFLEPKMTALREPAELPGVEQAVERIFAAITDQRRIVIYGDYDVDGISGCTI